MKYTEQAGWYCIVTEKNQDMLTEWRNTSKIPVGYYIGISKDSFTKGHNPYSGYLKNDGEYFDKEVTIEELFEATDFKYKKELDYEIY